jgi:PilZ domain
MPVSPKGAWSTLKRKNLRRHRRYAVKDSLLRTSWMDSAGNHRMTPCRVLNVSEEGIALELPEGPPLNSIISFESEKHKLVGGGRVRHVARSGLKFIVGSEFTNGLKWMPPPDQEIPEPIPLFGPEP